MTLIKECLCDCVHPTKAFLTWLSCNVISLAQDKLGGRIKIHETVAAVQGSDLKKKN